MPEQPVAVNVAVSVPHRLVILAVTFGADGFPPLVIEITAFSLVPQLFLQEAKYVPATDAVSVLPVAPVFHVTVPEQFDAVRVAVSVPHRLVLSAVTIGADGAVHPQSDFALIVIGVDDVLVPQAFLQVAE